MKSLSALNMRRWRPIPAFIVSIGLMIGLVCMGDWLVFANTCSARGGGGRGGFAAGPRGAVASSPRGSVAVGPRGGVAARGAYGGAAVRGPGGSAAVRGPAGGAAARGPYGNVVAAPRGRVVGPAVPVPVPVGGYYGYGPSGSGVAAGVALGAMLTVLPAAAIAISNSSHETVYRVEKDCYREIIENGTKVYQQISCP